MADIYRHAAEIRVLVGYLAEQKAAWVPSQFFGPRAISFIGPVFARTTFQAQCHGVSAALARLHDDAVGVGRTHHLFRLPEVLEQGVASTLSGHEPTTALRLHLQSPDAALERLQAISTPSTAQEGPLAVAGTFQGDAFSLVSILAGLYSDAFSRGIRTFPFLRQS